MAESDSKRLQAPKVVTDTTEIQAPDVVVADVDLAPSKGIKHEGDSSPNGINDRGPFVGAVEPASPEDRLVGFAEYAEFASPQLEPFWFAYLPEQYGREARPLSKWTELARAARGY